MTQLAAADAALRNQVDELLDEQKKARESGDVGAIEKHGIPTGHFAINPYNGERAAHLGSQLRAHGLRHRRHHERARP